MRKIEHLGIAVKDLETSKQLFSRLLGGKSYKEEEVADKFEIGDYFFDYTSQIISYKGQNQIFVTFFNFFL